MLALLILSGILPIGQQADEAAVPSQPPLLLVVHDVAQTGGERQVIDRLLETLGNQARMLVHEDVGRSTEAESEVSNDARLRAYAAMKRTEAQGTWSIRFLAPLGIVQIEGFDGVQGVRAGHGTKIRSMASEQLSEEHLARLDQSIATLRSELDARVARLADPRAAPYREEIVWKESEDPPHPGFRWTFEGANTVVRYVYAPSATHRAGLEVGDRLLSINALELPSPAHFARALGPLKCGDPLRLTVQRGETVIELTSEVESSAALVPRWQAAIMNQPLPPLGARFATLTSAPSDALPPKILIVVYDPALEDTRDGFAVLRWLRDRHPEEELALVGIARRANAATVAELLEALLPGWPSIPDPDGTLTDALRVERLPAYLLVDRGGVLRFRQVDEKQLRPAIASL